MGKIKTFLACAILFVTAVFTSSSLTAAGCGGGSCAYGPYAGNRTGWGTNQNYYGSSQSYMPNSYQYDGSYQDGSYQDGYSYGSSYSYPSYDGHSYNRGMNYSYPSSGYGYGYGSGYGRSGFRR